jgi:hypothetical protein
MRQDQVIIGGEYCVRIGSRLAQVTVLAKRQRHSYSRTTTYFDCVTGDTGRQIEASAARLRPLPGLTVPESRAAAIEAERKLRRQAEAARRQAEAARRQADDRAGVIGLAASLTGWGSAAGLADHLDQWLDRVEAEAGRGARVEADTAILRALDAEPRLVADRSWHDIAAYGRRQSAGSHLSQPRRVAGMIERVNRGRAVELPAGANLAILRGIVDRCHVAESLLSVARRVRQRMGRHGTRRLPVPLRRGLWQAAAEMLGGNRSTYRAVMGHAPLPSESMVAAAVGVAVGLGSMPR